MRRWGGLRGIGGNGKGRRRPNRRERGDEERRDGGEEGGFFHRFFLVLINIDKNRENRRPKRLKIGGKTSISNGRSGNGDRPRNVERTSAAGRAVKRIGGATRNGRNVGERRPRKRIGGANVGGLKRRFCRFYRLNARPSSGDGGESRETSASGLTVLAIKTVEPVLASQTREACFPVASVILVASVVPRRAARL